MVARFGFAPNPVAPPSLHISAGSPMSAVVAAMCGLFHYTWKGNHYTFDIKLWHHVKNASAVSLFVVPLEASNKLLTVTRLPPPPRLRVAKHWIGLLCGLTYLSFTLIGNIAYLDIVRESLSNDFFWAGFNTSGMYPFLANQINTASALNPHQVVVLDDGSYGDTTQQYSAPDTLIRWDTTAAHRTLFDPTTPLATVVTNLRAMDPCRLPWMFSQYCWLDMAQRWDMAVSALRQIRCQRHSSNGAIFFETGLRNIVDWGAWTRCWGVSYENGFAQYLSTTTDGLHWLESTQTAALTTLASAEVAYWSAHGVASFVLQWQNYKTMGWSDAFTVTNAFGFMYTLPLSNVPAAVHLRQETSMRMYWTLASDMWAISANTTRIGGGSLLRKSPLFAFANVTTEALLYDNETLQAPLTSGLSSLRARLGPFNAVDMWYVPCPASVRQLAATIAARLAQLLRLPGLAAAFAALPVRDTVQAIPRVLLANSSGLVAGGNIFCGNDVAPYPPYGGLYSFFSAGKACHSLNLELLFPTAAQLVFAILGLNASASPSQKWSAVCELDTMAPASCAEDYSTFETFLNVHSSHFARAETLANDAYFDVGLLNVSVVQFMATKSFLTVADLALLPLFRGLDKAYAFYEWCFLHEWAMGKREVVKLEGDAGSITALSAAEALLSMPPDADSVPYSFTWLLQYGCQYITTVLIGVVGLGAIHMVVMSHSDVEGLNLFCFNRLVGLVWVGRPLLLVRSVTALALLNTSTLSLETTDGYTYSTSPPLPWNKTVLAAAEVTWLVYVLNDLGSCVTLQYTSIYAFKSANAAWAVGIASTYLMQVAPTCRLERSCNFIDMDAGVKCTSGAVIIGSLARVQLLSGLAVVCVVGCFVIDKWRWPNLRPLDLVTASLNAQSIYMLKLGHWKHGGEYFLDTTSAVMAGLFTLKRDGLWYVFDIKTWRLFIRPVVQFDEDLADHNRRFQRAIPISRI
ncbi:hypothetical protein ACHHYP_05793 [Achlya hypogyna]|uniref:Transmembrane protein n=1 Tax=Achlya hypogyna TaxID=1202772 RepID=A0A1V9YWD9_ACHHY|nr:hypothetical protein ACHHYP_05793 [Achlya hypogyna]